MKILFVIFIIGAINMYYPLLEPVLGQHVEYPKAHFRNMTFDWGLRGSWNISECLRDLMNCWEIIKPELICVTGGYYRDTACGVPQADCYDTIGYYGSYALQFTMFETYCDSYPVAT